MDKLTLRIVSLNDPAEVGNSIMDKYNIEIALHTAVVVISSESIARRSDPDVLYFMAIAMRISKEKGWQMIRLALKKILFRKFSIDSPGKIKGYIMLALNSPSGVIWLDEHIFRWAQHKYKKLRRRSLRYTGSIVFERRNPPCLRISVYGLITVGRQEPYEAGVSRTDL